jgi:phenylalanyl-tRNA synthetase alpha chain
MTAHSSELLAKGNKSFITIGDVYRKDEVDRSHYPIFHQLDAVKLITKEKDSVLELKTILSELVEFLFPKCEYRFNSDYFPFTEPSFEIEVKYNDKWLEILGSGILHKEITKSEDEYMAFGLGIERLAMIFFEIPDIRLFWSTDEKFLNQFNNINITDFTNMTKFKSYSILDPIYRDVSFWLNSDEITFTSDDFEWINVNSFYEAVREIFGDDIENVNLYDKFYHKKKELYSHTFRLTFSPNNETANGSLFCEQTNKKMDVFVKSLKEKLSLEIR